MKFQITLCCLFLSILCSGQNFEGVIKWSITSEVTDPKLKAQMEESEKRMNDPATQARMKEMEKKMNDPQFKTMMEANPQMKAQMESMMKMQSGSMMPKSITVKIKKGNTRSAMEGGMMAGFENLYLKEKNETYVLNNQSKTYSLMIEKNDAKNKPAPPMITKTNETQTILKYKCTKVIVTVTEAGKTVDQIFWTTKEIKEFDLKSLSKQRVGGSQAMLYENIEGVPLKIEMITHQAKMTMEVTEIKKEAIDDAIFRIPAGFTEIKSPEQP